jgi:3-oxoacyl-[acyl-carrier protein] reductase
MNKNVLITGTSKGLGLEITKHLLFKDYNVYSISRTVSNELNELKNIYNNSLNFLIFDLANTNELKKTIFKEFINLDLPIHAFINNAAIAYDDLITNTNLDTLVNMYYVNVFSPIMLSKSIIRNMILHKTKGSIVHISSISVHTGYKGLSLYASTKGAIEALSKNIAREWGEYGIRSNCIVAGFMETDMNLNLSEELKNRIYKRTALKIPTQKECVASTVEFLLSDKSNSITGQNIFVDSGTI